MESGKLVLGAALASVIAVGAFAHSGATGVVKERMDGMGAMREAMKALAPMMQGQAPFDAEIVRRNAEIIAAHSGGALTNLFPQGTAGAPSEAKAEIWQDWARFAQLAEQLRVSAQGLAVSAENGLGMADTGAAAMMGGGGMTAQSPMMGGAAMMGQGPEGADFGQMPADGAFAMLGQVCSACHTRFRSEK